MSKLSRIFFIGTSVCCSAFSMHAQTDIFSYIINQSQSSQRQSTATNPRTGYLDVLSEIADGGNASSEVDLNGALSVAADPYGIGAALSAVTGSNSNIQSSLSPVNSLNYITRVYETSNFYQNGFMGQTMGVYSNLQSHPGYQGTIYTPEWGRITSGFGYRARFHRLHKGIDIAMAKGDTVRSAMPGIVEKVGYEPKGYGHYVVVCHENGMETRYAHLTTALVSAGQPVEAGQPIALSGNTGKSTGPHLHFETRYQGSAIDPRTVFDFSSSYMNGYARMVAEKKSDSKGMTTGFNGTKVSLQSKSTYIVRQGDTVKKIAKRAGISPLRLCQLNFITENELLQPGTMLKLR